MSNEEILVAGVRSELDAERPEMRQKISLILSAIQPYATYEYGDYSFNSCD